MKQLVFTPIQLAYVLRGIAVGLLVTGGFMAIAGAYPIIRSELVFEINQRSEAQEVIQASNYNPNRTSFGEILLIPPVLKQTPITPQTQSLSINSK